jgi:hypothetical protein
VIAYNPLEPGGVDDYPVKVGSMLFSLVDPFRGYEKAFNRWYERDHYYGGCLTGPYLFAGSRWVATRELKNLRWPTGDTTVADPADAGSYLAMYWVEKDHHEDHFEDWSGRQVLQLYQNGRGFEERTHVHTALFDHLGAVYRQPDPVPVDLALDHGYDGIIALWFDAREGRDAPALHRELAGTQLPAALKDSNIELASSWNPSLIGLLEALAAKAALPQPEQVGERAHSSPGEDAPRTEQMPLGSRVGGRERLVQLLFVSGDVREALCKVRQYTDAVTDDGLAELHLAAPFVRTVVGTDTYIDQLW